MDSRSKILAALKEQLRPSPLIVPNITSVIELPVNAFSSVLKAIGGNVLNCNDHADVRHFIKEKFTDENRIFSTIDELGFAVVDAGIRFRDVELVILKGRFAVAENGAVWITDEEMPDRVLPFITQHLILVVDKKSIVPTMHEAYEIIGNTPYEFATFIAGPSKTADIEQSLVLGAHGPKTMTVVLME